MNFDSGQLILGIGWYLVFVFSTCFHEAAHAWSAHRLGDSTAYHGGQVTLNPIPHIQREPFGMVLVPILSFILGGIMFGWASAPYDARWANRYPKRAALMALAGPGANLIIFVIAGILLRAGLETGFFAMDPASLLRGGTAGALDGARGAVAAMLGIFFFLNLILFVFNLLPLPPLDGSAVPPLFLSWRATEVYLNFIRQPGFAFMGLIIAWYLFRHVFWVVAIPIIRLFLG